MHTSMHRNEPGTISKLGTQALKSFKYFDNAFLKASLKILISMLLSPIIALTI